MAEVTHHLEPQVLILGHIPSHIPSSLPALQVTANQALKGPLNSRENPATSGPAPACSSLQYTYLGG